MITYIIKTKKNEFYCGKTTSIGKRLREHLSEKSGWFSHNNRKDIDKFMLINGDQEKAIKRFGVRRFYLVCKYHDIFNYSQYGRFALFSGYGHTRMLKNGYILSKEKQ